MHIHITRTHLYACSLAHILTHPNMNSHTYTDMRILVIHVHTHNEHVLSSGSHSGPLHRALADIQRRVFHL